MKQKDWLYLAIFSFLSVLVWITYEVYHSYTTSTVSKVDKNLTRSLDPQIDIETVLKLEEEN